MAYTKCVEILWQDGTYLFVTCHVSRVPVDSQATYVRIAVLFL